MPGYDGANFKPPAPIAMVTIRSLRLEAIASGVPMLLDSGADVTLLPRDRVSHLIENENLEREYHLEAFDGTASTAPVVQLELQMLGKSFRGQFLLIDSQFGILGRNILNSLSVLLDGPAQTWNLSH